MRRMPTPRHRIRRTSINRVTRVHGVTFRSNSLPAVTLPLVNRRVTFPMYYNRDTGHSRQGTSSRHRNGLAILRMFRHRRRNRHGARPARRVTRRSRELSNVWIVRFRKTHIIRNFRRLMATQVIFRNLTRLFRVGRLHVVRAQ